jgi:hypothetical protein
MNEEVIADEKLIDEDRAFFCSELVVKTLKVCGMMAETKEASSNFLPGDFTEAANKIKLVEGAHFGPEQFIIVSHSSEV